MAAKQKSSYLLLLLLLLFDLMKRNYLFFIGSFGTWQEQSNQSNCVSHFLPKKKKLRLTPVSASIHATTMVKAGVFMIARCSPLFEYPPTLLEQDKAREAIIAEAIEITELGGLQAFNVKGWSVIRAAVEGTLPEIKGG